MPELPEVEVTRRGLLPLLMERTIVNVSWSDKRLRLPIPGELIQTCVCDNRVTGIDRRAKYLLIRMEDSSVLIFHLGMTGKLGIFPTATQHARHDHLCLGLDNAMELRYNDARRFGSIMAWPAEQARTLEDEFNRTKGVEPFSKEFTGIALQQIAHGRRVAIKTFLMDSRLIAGVGNIYANESLFAAGIHPETRVNTMSEAQWQRLAKQIIAILSRAIEAGGSTVSDFLGASGQPGYFQLQLAVYGKKDAPCPCCGTSITRKTIGGRAAFFCEQCQQ